MVTRLSYFLWPGLTPRVLILLQENTGTSLNRADRSTSSMDSDHCDNKVCSTSSTGSDQSANKVCLTSSRDSRIVNLGQLNNYLNKIAVHTATCEAYQNKIGSSPNEMTLIMEEACYGMASILAYQCCGCGNQISFASSTKITSPEGNKYWTCNLAAVWGQMATGGGYKNQ